MNDLSAGRNRPKGLSFNGWSSMSDTLAAPLVTRAEGCYFWDENGKRYLDLTAQLFNVQLGHQDPRIVAAIKAQADELCFISPFYRNRPRERLAELLAEVSPGDLNTSFFVNSGTEAVDAALTFARMLTGRPKVMSRYRSYHGTANSTLAVSGDPRRLGSLNALPGAVRFPNPYCYRCPLKQTYPGCGVACATSLEELIQAEGPEQIAAILVEPVTGGNGPIIPPPEYYGVLRELCDRYGVLLIADEVINGFGRTGKWFAIEHWGVVPDMMTLSKGINGGALPLGAVLMRDAIAARFEDRSIVIGSTQTGNPIACAAGVAAIEAYKADGLIEQAAAKGRYLLEKLQALQAKHALIGEVRGLGLLATVELVKDRVTREPLIPWNKPHRLQDELKRMFRERGVGLHVRSNQIVLSPPLIITEAQLDEGVAAIDDALGELAKLI